MATGRIGVTPTLRTRWSKAPAGGTTSLSGLDDNSVSLVYDVGYEGVYRNGVLLSRGNDYTATDGTTVTLIDATIAGDIIEIFANELIPLSDAISKGQYTAKGALLSATAASTPGVLTVGSNDQVLTADSSTSTGLKWATPSSGGMTLLNGPSGTTFTGSTLTINITPTGYTSLKIYLKGVYATADATMQLRFNGDTGSNYSYVTVRSGPSQVTSASSTSIFYVNQGSATSGTDVKVLTYAMFDIFDPNATDMIQVHHSSMNGPSGDMRYTFGVGSYDSSAAITSISFIANSGSFSGGTAYVYGVK